MIGGTGALGCEDKTLWFKFEKALEWMQPVSA